MRPRVFFAATVIGVLTGVDDFLYACGVSRLPVSTTSIIIASPKELYTLVTNSEVHAVFRRRLMLPMVEMTYNKAKHAITNTPVTNSAKMVICEQF
ncbi:hypothetical protein LXL04_038217 [Taraxacum kok-saghyz]